MYAPKAGIDRRNFLVTLAASLPAAGKMVSEASAQTPVEASDLVRRTNELYEGMKRGIRVRYPDFVPIYDETGLLDLNPGPRIRINNLQPLQYSYQITIEDKIVYGHGGKQLPLTLKMTAREENGALYVYQTEESHLSMQQEVEDLAVSHGQLGNTKRLYKNTQIPAEYPALANAIFKDWKAGRLTQQFK